MEDREPPEGRAPPRHMLTEAAREQIELRAAFLNGLVIAIFAVGGLAPLIGAVFGDGDRADFVVAVATSVVCFTVSGALHPYASRHLEGLDR